MSALSNVIRDELIQKTNRLVEDIVGNLYVEGHLQEWTEEKKKEIMDNIVAFSEDPSLIADRVVTSIERQYV